MLTQAQSELLSFLREYPKDNDGVSPSFDEMREHLGLANKSGVHRLITALQERGFIRRLPNRARAIEVVEREKCQSELAGFTNAELIAELAARDDHMARSA